MHAVAMFLRQRIERSLPPGSRGVNAPLLSQEALASRARQELEGLAQALASEVAESIPVPRVIEAPEASTASKEPPQRVSVMDNEFPCESCGEVFPVAIHLYRGASVVGAECELCAPEFKG